MRSLLIAPPREEQLAAALLSGADATHRQSRSGRAGQKDLGADPGGGGFLKETRGARRRATTLIVRVNPLAFDSGETVADLDSIAMALTRPTRFLLPPRAWGPRASSGYPAKLAVREAEFALDDGSTRIIALADAARSLFGMGSYRGSSARLSAIAWSVEELRNDIGSRNGPRPIRRFCRPLSPGARLGASSPRLPQARRGDRHGLRGHPHQ